MTGKEIINVALDFETTGFKPTNSRVVSLGMVIFDNDYNILGEFYEEAGGFQSRFEKDIFGRDFDIWPDEATGVHGITFERQRSNQPAISLFRNLWIFLQQWKDYKFNLIFHANNTIDLDFLFYKTNIMAEPLYKFLVNRTYTYEYDDEKDEVTNSTRHDNTMKMAREYRKRGADILKKTTKMNNRINKLTEMLTKERKTPLSKAKADAYKSERADLSNDLVLMDMNNVTFEKVSLDHLCEKLGIELRHHVAIDDARALVGIHKFLNNNL